MNNLRKLALDYFDLFSKKDLNSLEKMFSKDISLRDWEIEAYGLAKVIEANRKIFSSVETIVAKPKVLIIDDFRVAAELEIIVNDKDTLRVVDIDNATRNGNDSDNGNDE